MKLPFIIRCFECNILGTPSHIFVKVICHCYLSWVFAAAICRGNLPWLFAVGICCSYLPWLFPVRIYRSYLPWLSTVGICCSYLPWEFAMAICCGNFPQLFGPVENSETSEISDISENFFRDIYIRVFDFCCRAKSKTRK